MKVLSIIAACMLIAGGGLYGLYAYNSSDGECGLCPVAKSGGCCPQGELPPCCAHSTEQEAEATAANLCGVAAEFVSAPTTAAMKAEPASGGCCCCGPVTPTTQVTAAARASTRAIVKGQ